jgi:cell division protein FtsL
MKRPTYLLIFIITIIIGLSLAQIAISNTLSTNGRELAALEKEIDGYKKQNMLLNEQVLQASALTTIDAEAQKVGFVEADSQVYLSTPLPLALRE